MTKILCFGDSNTLGIDPMDNWEVMDRSWPVILGDLVEDADIEVDGVCHRTTSYTMMNDQETNGIYSFKTKYVDKGEVFDTIIIMLGTNDAQLVCTLDPVRLFSAIVIGNNGNHTVVESEYRHEHKALELEIHAKDGSGCG